MVKRHIMFTYTPELVKEPVIYTLGQQFNVVTNVTLADIDAEKGWVIVELEGRAADIDAGLEWAISRGLRYEDITEKPETGRRDTR